MRRYAPVIVALVLVLALGQASAARSLKAARAETLGGQVTRALRQVGDAFTRWGTGGGTYIDDGSRGYGTAYSAISGYAEPTRYNNYYGYYGNSVAAGYFGGAYPDTAQLALYRNNPSAGTLLNRAAVRAAVDQSMAPYDV